MVNHRKKFTHTYEDIISKENLLAAWREFLRGKRNKRDVQKFQYNLFDEITLLHRQLQQKTYRHGGYTAFNISDPKPRIIHKATVRDRLLHHALHRKLYPFFDKIFISDSYSCRTGKGTLAAINRFRSFGYKVGKNNTRTVWVLKCDIQKFFASIDHKILIKIMKQYIKDKNIVWLIKQIVYSFHSARIGKGLPLGNLTSQLFVNIYMNEFDQYVKHKLKIRFYIRYTDDFILVSHDKKFLKSVIPKITYFLTSHLALTIHPRKIFIKTLSSGVDFLGWVHFPDHRVLRTATKRRILKRGTVQPYFGLLCQGNTYLLTRV